MTDGLDVVIKVNNDDWTPLYLSCIAGASTCIGAAIVFCHPKAADNSRIVSANTMSFSLALAGSVMMTVSIVSIGPECLKDTNFEDEFRLMNLNSFEFLQRIISFGFGGFLYYAISLSFPEPDQVLRLHQAMIEEERGLSVSRYDIENSKAEAGQKIRFRRQSSVGDLDTSSDEGVTEHSRELTTDALVQHGEYSSKEKSFSWKSWGAGTDLKNMDQRRAWRVAMLLFISLVCHNFPEGLAVAASAMESTKLGITVTIGIMIHNIPEGIAIAVPCLAARPDMPGLAFALASLSGLAEPLGALVALLCLQNVSKSSNNMFSMENVLAFVGGVMITVALYELFPEANRHTSSGKAALIAGTLLGIIIMVTTEVYLP